VGAFFGHEGQVVRADFDSGQVARRGRLIGRVVFSLIVLGVGLMLLQRLREVSEEQNLQATREHLASSLLSLSAESIAQHKALPQDVLTHNPFELLRWQQDDYCGELEPVQEPEPGCWYFLPKLAWVLYRSEFSDEVSESGDKLHLFRIQAVPANTVKDAQLTRGQQALELQPVSAAERQAVTLWSD
jgi:hypothetical protein